MLLTLWRAVACGIFTPFGTQLVCGPLRHPECPSGSEATSPPERGRPGGPGLGGPTSRAGEFRGTPSAVGPRSLESPPPQRLEWSSRPTLDALPRPTGPGVIGRAVPTMSTGGGQAMPIQLSPEQRGYLEQLARRQVEAAAPAKGDRVIPTRRGRSHGEGRGIRRHGDGGRRDAGLGFHRSRTRRTASPAATRYGARRVPSRKDDALFEQYRKILKARRKRLALEESSE